MSLSQFVPLLRSNDLMGFVDGSESCPSKFILADQGKVINTLNPVYLLCTKKDQFVLSWINATLSKKLGSFFYVWSQPCSTSMAFPLPPFDSQSRSRITHLKRKLQNLHQGSKGCTEYSEAAKKCTTQLICCWWTQCFL